MALSVIRASLLLVLLSLVVSGVRAEEATTSELDALRAEIAQRDRLIEALASRYAALEARIARIEAQSDSAPTVADATPKAVLVSTDPQQHAEAGPSEPEAVGNLEAIDRREQDRLIRSAFENTLVDRGGLLLPAWNYDIETSLTYVHSSSDNIVIDGFTIFPVLVVGDIQSERLTRDVNLANLTLRMGLPWDSQAEVRIPYGHQTLRSYRADGVEDTFRDGGLGDIEFALSRQLYRSRGKWPDLVANLRWKSKTGSNPFTASADDVFVGTGYPSTNLSLNAVKVIDPVVYFAGLGYTHNHSTKQEIGEFAPGDTWGFNVGMAIALNLNNSFSMSYDHQFTQKSELDGQSIPGSYRSTGVFSVGSSLLVTDLIAVDLSLGIGVTADSPDLLISASLPIRGKL